ncbi:MAG: hypothetical protein AAGG75_04025 [Bacteroidota bacterium]
MRSTPFLQLLSKNSQYFILCLLLSFPLHSYGQLFLNLDFEIWVDGERTYEHFFNAIDLPIFLLDLRPIKKEEACYHWLFQNLSFREVGAGTVEDEFKELQIVGAYDMIIFIKTSSPSRLQLTDE